MNYKRHIIKNFPKNYPLRKKIVANLIFFFGRTIIHNRQNALNSTDLIKATHILRPGDVVIVGGLRRLSCLVIGDVITHSLLYVGQKTFIHSVADGVEEVSLDDVFAEYDTLAILRPQIEQKIIKKAISYAHNQIGKPFDYEFNRSEEKFYCSKLIYFAFRNAGFLLKIKGKKIIYPLDFTKEKFRIVFTSHNLICKKGSLYLSGKQ